MEDILSPKPEWADSKPGSFVCSHEKCDYQTTTQDHLDKHLANIHPNEKTTKFVLYFECGDYEDDSLDGREKILEYVSADPIDRTGGQCACKDEDDIEEFGRQVIEAAEEYGIKLYLVCRMPDPGLGLIFPRWLVKLREKSGVITIPSMFRQRYDDLYNSPSADTTN